MAPNHLNGPAFGPAGQQTQRTAQQDAAKMTATLNQGSAGYYQTDTDTHRRATGASGAIRQQDAKNGTEARTCATTHRQPQTAANGPQIGPGLPAALAAHYRDLIGPNRPARVSKMQPKGSRAKYRDIPDDLTDAMLLRAAEGRVSYAVTIGTDGTTREAAYDVDHIGEDAEGRGRADLLAMLAEAGRRGYTAYAINVNTTGGHCGGHFRMAFSERVSGGDAEALVRDIARAAGLDPNGEAWPGKRQPLRLPLNYHTRAQTRGQLLTQDGEVINADDDLAAAVAHIVSLPGNAPPPEAPQIEPEPRPAPRPAQLVTTAAGDELTTVRQLIDRFNAHNPLERLAEGYGAARVPGGYSCPCGVQHTHDVTLYISKQGKLFSYSPRCHWYTTKGWDAFGLFCRVEYGGNTAAALRALRQRYAPPRKARHYDGAEPAQVEQARAQDAARKRQSRRDEAAETRAILRERLAADESLPERATVVCMLLLELAGERDWCRPSVARLVELSGFSERTVHRALDDLEGRYIASEGKGGRPGSTAIRTFLRVSQLATAEPQVAPEIIETCDLDTESDLACEPRAPSPATVEPCPAPELPAEAIAVEGGASYDPGADWTLIGEPLPKELRRQLVEQARAQVERRELAPDEPVPAPRAPQPVDEPLVKAAPADPERADKYYKLLGASAKAERAGNRKQAHALKMQADRLAEWIPRSVDEARRAERDAARSQAKEAPPSARPQLSLWDAPPVETPPRALTPAVARLLADSTDTTIAPMPPYEEEIPDAPGLIARLKQRRDGIALTV